MLSLQMTSQKGKSKSCFLFACLFAYPVRSSSSLTNFFYHKRFAKTFGGLEDLEIDVPNASEKIGDLIGKGLRSKWLNASSINKEIEKLPAKIKAKVQSGVGPDVRLG